METEILLRKVSSHIGDIINACGNLNAEEIIIAFEMISKTLIGDNLLLRNRLKIEAEILLKELNKRQ